MIGPGGLLLVVSHRLISSPSFTLMGGVAKKEITKLGRENCFLLGHMVSTIGDAFFHHQGAACERSRRSSSPKTYM